MGLGYWWHDIWNDSYAEKKYESCMNNYKELLAQIEKLKSYFSIAGTDFTAQNENWVNMPDADGVWVREYVERLDEITPKRDAIMQELREAYALMAGQALKVAESVCYWKEQMELEDKRQSTKTKEEYEGGRVSGGSSGSRR